MELADLTPTSCSRCRSRSGSNCPPTSALYQDLLDLRCRNPPPRSQDRPAGNPALGGHGPSASRDLYARRRATGDGLRGGDRKSYLCEDTEDPLYRPGPRTQEFADRADRFTTRCWGPSTWRARSRGRYRSDLQFRKSSRDGPCSTPLNCWWPSSGHGRRQRRGHPRSSPCRSMKPPRRGQRYGEIHRPRRKSSSGSENPQNVRDIKQVIQKVGRR